MSSPFVLRKAYTYAVDTWLVFGLAVFAVIPVKSLGSSKGRLSTMFTPQERSLLTLAMLEDVLRALQASTIDNIVVIGCDDIVQRLSDRFDALYLKATLEGLNSSIEEAFWCIREQADWLLVLPADIPLLRPVDVNRIVELGVSNAEVILSPSHDGGTNALFQCTPRLITPCFGPTSFAVHVQAARQKDVKVRFYGSLNVMHDIDCAENLRKILEIENNTLCREALEQIIRYNKDVRDYFVSTVDQT